MKKPKAPKRLKKPKQSASVAVWERYDKKVTEQQKKHAERLKAYTSHHSKRKTDSAKKDRLIKKHS